MLNTAIERKLSVNCILHLKLFLQNMFWSQSFGTQSFDRKPRLPPLYTGWNLLTVFPVCLTLSLVVRLLFSGVCRCLRTTGWWKLVKETKSPAGVGWGPDIVLALGWGAACQGPLYEGCSPWKTYLFIPVCGPASDPGPCCSLRTRDPGCCRWQQIKIAVNHSRAHNTSINGSADKGCRLLGPRLNGTVENPFPVAEHTQLWW